MISAPRGIGARSYTSRTKGHESKGRVVRISATSNRGALTEASILLFCGLNCVTEWVTDEKSVELLNSARAERATTAYESAYESFIQMLVAAGAVDRQEPEAVDSLVDDLDGELGLHHMPMHHCTQCEQPRPLPESFIVFSPGMLKGRGLRRRRVLSSWTCLSAPLRSDIERTSHGVGG